MSNLIKPVKSVIESSRQGDTTFNFLRFPEDLGAHCMVLNFKQYSYRKSRMGGNAEAIPRGAVVLPLPENLSDTFDMQMNGSSIGFWGNATADRVSAAKESIDSFNPHEAGRKFGQAASGVVQSADAASFASALGGEGTLSALSDNLSAARYMLRRGFSSLPGGVGAGIDVGAGTVANPHVAVQFEGMNLKNHTFNWSFAPKSPKESEDLKKIGNYFSRNVLPNFGSGLNGTIGTSEINSMIERGILKYPNMVDVFFLGIDQSYFYYFKRCMVQNFSRDFSPQGQHTFLKGGRPAFVNMSLNLIETTIHTAEDYQDDA